MDEEAWLSSAARCRISTATSVCVSITILLIISIGIFGGVYLYRQFKAHEVSTKGQRTAGGGGEGRIGERRRRRGRYRCK
ncbi:hypothetical protein E2C01_080486 [Portunus trituberculatus]|uniref:Uncharacterized protein n=1 Tax=Portunus trituberculatus TaxID=210409 RepID=A0A5B7IPD5_PORTR|nr:hypothetical protein [Portunus trituberculatus]